MFVKDSKGIYTSSLFSQFPGLVHGFSTRTIGDGRTERVQRDMNDILTGGNLHFVQAQQVHGNRIGIVTDSDKKNIFNADGLVALPNSHAIIGVRTADCVPILLVDPSAHIVAAIHAGWKSTRSEIVKHAVEGMISRGATGHTIYALIGPHIGMCCYSVPEERAELFRAMYPHDERAILQKDMSWYIDIGWMNYRQLASLGVLPDHIDAPVFCTSCQHKEFYSYRKDTKETFGEMLGMIGFYPAHTV